MISASSPKYAPFDNRDNSRSPPDCAYSKRSLIPAAQHAESLQRRDAVDNDYLVIFRDAHSAFLDEVHSIGFVALLVAEREAELASRVRGVPGAIRTSFIMRSPLVYRFGVSASHRFIRS